MMMERSWNFLNNISLMPVPTVIARSLFLGFDDSLKIIYQPVIKLQYKPLQVKTNESQYVPPNPLLRRHQESRGRPAGGGSSFELWKHLPLRAGRAAGRGHNTGQPWHLALPLTLSSGHTRHDPAGARVINILCMGLSKYEQRTHVWPLA